MTAVAACSALAGCTAPSTRARPEHLIAVRYDLQPRTAESAARKRLEVLLADLPDIADLGFETVLPSPLDENDCKGVLDLAVAVGLTVAPRFHDLEQFVVTGGAARQRRQAGKLIRGIPGEITGHPALRILVIGAGSDTSSTERACSLCDAARRRGVPCVVSDETGRFVRREWRGLTAEAGGVVAIDTDGLDDDSSGSPVGRFLGQYHAGLAEGRTAGLIVDRFRSAAGDGVDTVPGFDSMSTGRRAALAELILRARHWGPRLFNSTPLELSAVGGTGELRTSGFVRGRRMHILVSNPAPDRHVRGDVVLSTYIGGAPVSRAVEVPAPSDAGAGRVIRARLGRITIPVSLRPGDAALFEIF